MKRPEAAEKLRQKTRKALGNINNGPEQSIARHEPLLDMASHTQWSYAYWTANEIWVALAVVKQVGGLPLVTGVRHMEEFGHVLQSFSENGQGTIAQDSQLRLGQSSGS